MQETTTTTTTASESGMGEEAMAERLSSLENLYFPRSIQPSAATPSQRKSILLDLLRRDAAVFLERYGQRLTDEELRGFDAKRGDYEVNWHLNHLRTAMRPTTEEARVRLAVVKNRRRAYMSRLVREGSYFSEDAMREREPYLHHEYVGRFQDVSGRGMARPGERWSETLMRRCEEAVLVEKIRAEQRRLGVAEKDWVGNAGEEEKEEEEEEEEEEDACRSEVNPNGVNNGQSGGEAHQKTRLSEAEMQDQMESFTYIMQQKFLSGEDTQHLDYAKIDNDETLDDHWLREANLDAEDKYFSED